MMENCLDRFNTLTIENNKDIVNELIQRIKICAEEGCTTKNQKERRDIFGLLCHFSIKDFTIFTTGWKAEEKGSSFSNIAQVILKKLTEKQTLVFLTFEDLNYHIIKLVTTTVDLKNNEVPYLEIINAEHETISGCITKEDILRSQDPWKSLVYIFDPFNYNIHEQIPELSKETSEFIDRAITNIVNQTMVKLL